MPIWSNGLTSDHPHPRAERLYFPRSSRSVRLLYSSRWRRSSAMVVMGGGGSAPPAEQGTERRQHPVAARRPQRFDVLLVLPGEGLEAAVVAHRLLVEGAEVADLGAHAVALGLGSDAASLLP